MTRPLWLTNWLDSVIQSSQFKVQDIPLSESTEWFYRDGAIRHKTGRFFSIIGLQWKKDKETFQQPFIDQQEVGTLGFLVSNNGKKVGVLVQAKIEPGNIGAVQLGPTCQATASNAARVHGGLAPHFSKWFEQNQGLVCARLHSEQGTRFYKKFNLNTIGHIAQQYDVPNDTHRWIDTEQFCGLVTQDFLINTDARSVLVSSPWEKLFNRPLFTRYQTSFAKELQQSLLDDTPLPAFTKDLKKMQQSISDVEIVDLKNISDWRLTASGLQAPKLAPFRLRQVRVTIRGREVPIWDQPIVDTRTQGSIDLVCGREKGLLKFLINPQVEPGLGQLVELGPSHISNIGRADENKYLDRAGASVLAECRQSEEGGRFFRDVNRYRLIDIGRVIRTKRGYWLSLAQLRSVLSDKSLVTNEGRSAVSLLFRWI